MAWGEKDWLGSGHGVHARPAGPHKKRKRKRIKKRERKRGKWRIRQREECQKREIIQH